MTAHLFYLLCLIWTVAGIVTYFLLQFVTAPYGRHIEKGWGPEIDNRTGWILMEIPSFLIILYFFWTYPQSSFASMLSLLWLLHYANRSFIYPFRIRTRSKKMPLAIVVSAIFFNCVNAGLNGYYLSHLASYPSTAFQSWNFYLGIGLFVFGFVINQISDHRLINLREPGETGYHIPRGFFFNYVSCPNLLGELIEWSGFALMAWNFPAFSFLIWTMANLIPRAKRHHQWYQSNFENYPKKRKAIIPWLF